jgi:hypothetical protein
MAICEVSALQPRARLRDRRLEALVGFPLADTYAVALRRTRWAFDL